MSLLNVRNLTFHYEGSPDTIFENMSFQIDTDWKLGFISRNGRGKTTMLRLLMGEMTYRGEIDASVSFDYFPQRVPDTGKRTLDVVRGLIAPFDAWESEMEQALQQGDDASLTRYGVLQELMIQHDGYLIDELIAKEAGKLQVAPSALERPFDTLSSGERTKLQIAALFLKKNNFQLIDEPTNHLDLQGRQVMERYLSGKKGFILVSHDRALLDGVCDHMLSINRGGIEVQRGNYASWRHNRDMQDQYELARNEQIKGEMDRLDAAMRRNANWSDKIEATKIGTHAPDRGYIGMKAAKMMKRAKAIETRGERALEEKAQLLRNIETVEALKLHPMPYFKKRLLEAIDLQVDYGHGPLFAPLTFDLMQGDRLALTGANGSGKSSIIKLLLGEDIPHSGIANLGSQLVVSYVSQDTSHLRGSLQAYAQAQGIDRSLFQTILRKLDFPRREFDRDIADYSGGQKKKVLLAASLATPAHLYIWDEPLNFVDVLSREQIEALVLSFSPTMVFVEHDRSFVDTVATRRVDLTAPYPRAAQSAR